MAQPKHWSTTSGTIRSQTAGVATPAEEVVAHLQQLYTDLLAVIERDPEQEILGVALPVVDWVISSARAQVAHADSAGLGAAMVDLISPAVCGDGVPVRALDAWLVVGQLLAAVGRTA